MSAIQNGKLSVKAIGVGAGISAAVILLLLCLMSVILLLAPSIPYDALPYLSLIPISIGIFVGSYIAAVISGSKGLLTGLCCGAVLFIILLIAGFADEKQSVSVLTLIHLAVCLLSGALGGVRGVNRKERLHIR